MEWLLVVGCVVCGGLLAFVAFGGELSWDR